jgi:LacI family transcriptional regulator
LNNKPPTLDDVGLACGLSPSTVSLALRGSGRIAKKTRERVSKIAHSLGYRPNTAAAALAAGRHEHPIQNRVIAVITSLTQEEAKGRQLLGGPHKLISQAEKSGYSARQVELGSVPDVQRAIRQLYHEGVDGVILDDVRVPEIDLFKHDWSAFAVTVHRRTRYTHGYDLVTPDPFHTVRTVWDEIRSRGYRRIGVILCRHQPLMIDDEWREGALYYSHGLLRNDESAVPPYLGLIQDNRAIMAWVRRHSPDAIIGFSDGDLWLLRKHLKIPSRVGYASLHSELSDPSVAGMCEQADVLAKMCVDHLDQLIRHRRLGRPLYPRCILLQNVWKPGATLPS